MDHARPYSILRNSFLTQFSSIAEPMHARLPRQCPIIHFDQLKRCPPTIRLEHVRKSRSTSQSSQQYTCRHSLIQLLEDDMMLQPIADTLTDHDSSLIDSWDIYHMRIVYNYNLGQIFCFGGEQLSHACI